MIYPALEPGRSYELTRQLEVRDEKSGVMQTYFLKGTILKVKKVVPDDDRVWVEGCSTPIPWGALRRLVKPVAEVRA